MIHAHRPRLPAPPSAITTRARLGDALSPLPPPVPDSPLLRRVSPPRTSGPRLFPPRPVSRPGLWAVAAASLCSPPLAPPPSLPPRWFSPARRPGPAERDSALISIRGVSRVRARPGGGGSCSGLVPRPCPPLGVPGSLFPASSPVPHPLCHRPVPGATTPVVCYLSCALSARRGPVYPVPRAGPCPLRCADLLWTPHGGHHLCPWGLAGLGSPLGVSTPRIPSPPVVRSRQRSPSARSSPRHGSCSLAKWGSMPPTRPFPLALEENGWAGFGDSVTPPRVLPPTPCRKAGCRLPPTPS